MCLRAWGFVRLGLIFHFFFTNILGDEKVKIMVTPTQQKIYSFIESYIAEYRYSPSLTEIAEGIGISPRSISLISRSIHALVKAGLLKFYKQGYRNIELVQNKRYALPIMGRIAAGAPIEAISDKHWLDIGDLLSKKSYFVLEVKGDSMLEEGIFDGDFVICTQAQEAREGDIIVALIDQQEVTLKRLSYQIKERITLIPANPNMKPKAYLPHRIQIQGVFAGLLRLKR